MTRVLLTGASGFIGRHCAIALRERGLEVHAISSTRDDQVADGVVWHRGNLLDAEQLKRVVGDVRADFLLHLAWYTTPGSYWTSLENYRWVAASLHLLRAFADAGGHRVVAAGSCAEYSWARGVCEESTPLEPRSPYGICKAALYNMLMSFADAVSISAAWGRVFFTFGPYEHPSRLVASVSTALLSGRSATCSDGSQRRDFLDVRDISSAFAALLASEVVGAVNVASGEPVAVRDIVEMIGACTGASDLVRFGAIPRQPDEPPLIAADVSRLRNEVRWTPQVGLAERIESTVEWWRGALASDGRGSGMSGSSRGPRSPGVLA